MSSMRCTLAGLALLAAAGAACDGAGDEARRPETARPTDTAVDRTPSASPAAAAPVEDSAKPAVPAADTGAAARTGAGAGSPAGDSAAAVERPDDVTDPGPQRPPSDLRGYDTVFVYVDGPLPADGLRGPLVALPRAVPAGADALSYALAELLAGPTEAEAASGASTWFSDGTAGMLRGVTLEDGFAVVDFDDFRSVIPNASSSAGSAMLMRHLEATAFQFPEVRRVEFRIDGDCEAFMAWLQIGCVPLPRSSFEPSDGFRTAVPRGR